MKPSKLFLTLGSALALSSAHAGGIEGKYTVKGVDVDGAIPPAQSPFLG